MAKILTIIDYVDHCEVDVSASRTHGRKTSYYHPEFEILVISGYTLSAQRKQMRHQAVMQALQNLGASVTDLRYESKKSSRKTKIAEEQLSLW